MEASLHHGLTQLALEPPLTTAQQRCCLQFLALVEKWNKHYNLTAVQGVAQMITRHLLDSLALLPHLPVTARLLDVGSGAGFPGIPLAIARPHTVVTLLDSQLKRCRFLRQATAELALHNTEVVETRVEQADFNPLFDAIVCRAFAPLPRLLALVGPLCQPGGTIYALKGQPEPEKLATHPGDFKLEQVTALHVPGLNASRHLLILRKH